MLSPGTAPAKQLQLPFARRGEASVGTRGEDAPVESGGLLEQVVERSNLFTALSRVKRNGGSPGIDGMSVKALPEHLKRRWPEIRESLLSGSCGFRSGRFSPAGGSPGSEVSWDGFQLGSGP